MVVFVLLSLSPSLVESAMEGVGAAAPSAAPLVIHAGRVSPRPRPRPAIFSGRCRGMKREKNDLLCKNFMHEKEKDVFDGDELDSLSQFLTPARAARKKYVVR